MKATLYILIFLFFLTACDCRIPLYIKNHEPENIEITVKYLKQGHYYEFDEFLLAGEILSNKSVKKDDAFNKRCIVHNVDSHLVKIKIPANSTVKIEPLYVAYNVDYLVLNTSQYSDTFLINGLHSKESYARYKKLEKNGTIEKLGIMPCYQVFNIRVESLKEKQPLH